MILKRPRPSAAPLKRQTLAWREDEAEAARSWPGDVRARDEPVPRQRYGGDGLRQVLLYGLAAPHRDGGTEWAQSPPERRRGARARRLVGHRFVCHGLG